MDHVVYVDVKAKELTALLDRIKTMIIRGSTGRKLPYGRINENDVLYFIQNEGSGVIQEKGVVENVYNSEKLSKEESMKLVKRYQDQLQLFKHQFKRWDGKRYLVLIGLKGVEPVSPLKIDRSGYGNMDDWLFVENINRVMVS